MSLFGKNVFLQDGDLTFLLSKRVSRQDMAGVWLVVYASARPDDMTVAYVDMNDIQQAQALYRKGATGYAWRQIPISNISVDEDENIVISSADDGTVAQSMRLTVEPFPIPAAGGRMPNTPVRIVPLPLSPSR